MEKMNEDVAGTYHMHTTTGDEKTTISAQDHEVFHRTANGIVYVTRDHIELIPTPSSDPNDPLNWPLRWKLNVLLCICCSGLMIAFCAAGIIPGFMLIAEAYHTSINRVSYLVSVNVLWLAFGPLIWRPVYLAAILITVVSWIACAVAKSYGVQVSTRMLQGFGASGAVAVGAGSIADVFFLHERGFYIGVWTALIQCRPFVSQMVNGAVIQALGWRWALWLMAIITGFFFVLLFCFLPETLYIRNVDAGEIERNTDESPKRKRLFAQTSFGRISPEPFSFLGFCGPLYMLKYPSAGLIALSCSLRIAMPDVGISNIVPLVFGEVYGWDPRAQGLSSAGLLVGCLLGEAFTGKVSDVYTRYRLKRNGGVFVREMRLHPSIPGLILMPFGLAGFGICVQHKTHWMGPVSMMAITTFGLQQIISMGMAYGIDCYRPQAPYVAAAMVFCRHLFGFTVNYWLLP